MKYQILSTGAVVIADLAFMQSQHPADFEQLPEAPAPAPGRDQLKIARDFTVSQIKVTTQAGNTFDGDEDSQGRMARAIIALSTGLAASINWTLADNTVIQATTQELTEALVLAGMAQAAVWVIPE